MNAEEPLKGRDHTMLAPHAQRLPHPYLDTVQRTGKHEWSVCYPAWNLLYYTCLCSLSREEPNLLVETGTNRGCSSVVLAQALIESGLLGEVITFELDEQRIEAAKQLFRETKTEHLITVVQGDTTETMPKVLGDRGVRFAFVDSGHTQQLCLQETEILYPLVKKAGGKFFYDNTMLGGVRAALAELRSQERGRNIVEFLNCSRHPPGCAVWQP